MHDMNSCELENCQFCREMLADRAERRRESEAIYRAALTEDQAVAALVEIIESGPSILVGDHLAAQALARTIVKAGWRKVS